VKSADSGASGDPPGGVAGAPDAGFDRGSDPRRRGRFAHVFGALDLGTNNCRLLVARPTPLGFRIVDSFSRIVRLGEGLGATGALSEAAIDRTLAALQVCAEKIRRNNVTRWRAVATEACRRASNCADFVARAKAASGLDIDIIATAEEVRLAQQGCAPLLDYEHRFALIFDIGGGSTELMWLKLDRNRAPHLIDWLSLPVGVVNLTERYKPADGNLVAYEAMIADVRERIEPFGERHGLAGHAAAGGVQMLGTSGTVTTVAAVALNLTHYDRNAVDGQWLNFPAAVAAGRRLAAMPVAQRQANPCIGVGRADLIVAGCAILEAIHGCWPAAHVRVADRGVREGILFELMRDADRDGRRVRPGT
jgi:exopolyphosphatase/guanosine-5'-triphosphate,3'-diphosphate pyrophosphatase